MSKFELRRQMAEVLKSMPAETKTKQSSRVAQLMLEHPKYKEAARLGIYLSTSNEIDTIQILRQALEIDNKKCFIPFVRQSGRGVAVGGETRMIMVELCSMADYERLPVNHYGIKEATVAPAESDNGYLLDLVIVPGVAFSRDGSRLGHGRGYYDEYLSKGRPYTIGLAFDEQLVENVYAVPDKDYRLDEVISSSIMMTSSRR